jgi:hypothetical protein
MPKKTYAASCQVYRYFNVETGECISAYYARRLPRGKVKVEVLNLAVKSKSPMEMRRSMSLPLSFRMLIAMGHKLNGLLTWSKNHLSPLMAKQKEAIFQQAAEMAQKIPLSVKHYPVSKRLFTQSHAAPVALPKENVKKKAPLIAEMQ